MGAAVSSKTNQRGAEKKKQKAYRKKVKQIAHNIVGVVKGANNSQGYMFEYGENALFIVIALQIGIGFGIQSDMPNRRDDLQKNAHQADRRSGFRKHEQGDNQRLVKDAVDFALSKKMLQRYDDPDGLVGLYINIQPAKWTVVLKSGEVVQGWTPSKRDLQPYLTWLEVDGTTDEDIWTDRDSRLLRSWSRQFR